VSYFAVIREAGPAWEEGGIFDQPAVSDHAAFMNALTDDGLVLLAGPLAGIEDGCVRVLLIVNAESEAEINRLLDDDPWAPTEQLRTISIEPWKILAGAERLGSADNGNHAEAADDARARGQARLGSNPTRPS
jgi:uncharacterized protein YciI